MNWFEGSISDAVATSINRNSIFVVYIEGSDEMSENMRRCLNSGDVSKELSTSRFVCVKLRKDSEGHKQFTDIYQIVPVPSLFFIGENGVPLEIIASDKSFDTVSKKIRSAITKFKGDSGNLSATATSKSEPTMDTADRNNPGSSASLPSLKSESASASSTSVNEPNIVPPVLTEQKPEQPNESEVQSKEDKTAEMERVQDLIKKNREENEKLEEEKEKERELARRRMGKEISQARKSQQEREIEEMRKELDKEKRLEAEARQRVLRQIEDDKANRAARLAAQQPTQSKPAEATPVPVQKPQADEARIQFKLPDGQSRTNTFPSSTTMRELRNYIDTNIPTPFKEYMLATTFPRREFSSRDLSRSLVDLELVPTSVVLILPVQGNLTVMQGGWTAAFTTMLWTLIQPLLDFGSYLRSLIGGRSNNDPPASSAEPSSSMPHSSSQEDLTQQQERTPYYAQQLGSGRSVRKRGNIHTLRDGSDSNDENNTWNGNSTQLM